MSLDVIYESYSTKIKSVYFLLSPSLPFPQKQNGKDVVGVGREKHTHPWMPVIKIHWDLTQWQLRAGSEMTNTLQSPLGTIYSG